MRCQVFGNLLTLCCALVAFANAGSKGDAEGRCVMLGSCAENPERQNQCLNCLYNGKPKLLDESHTKLLLDTCPHMVSELEAYGGKVCCSKVQVEVMAKAFTQAEQLLGRCPTCFSNWRKNFCSSTCSPDSASFLNVTRTRTLPVAKCGGTVHDPGEWPRISVLEIRMLKHWTRL